MSKEAEKDAILEKLKAFNKEKPLILDSRNPEWENLLSPYIHEFVHNNYVVTKETEELLFDYPEVYLTTAGIVFIENGGYSRQKRQSTMDNIWNRGYILISLAALGVSVYTCSRSTTSNVDSVSQQRTIDSLKKNALRTDSIIKVLNKKEPSGSKLVKKVK